MTRLVWDQTGERLYETGSDRAVLYLEDEHGAYPKGVAWNGFTGITESPSGADPKRFHPERQDPLSLFLRAAKVLCPGF